MVLVSLEWSVTELTFEAQVNDHERTMLYTGWMCGIEDRGLKLIPCRVPSPLLLPLLDWGLWILVWELEDEYSGIQLFQLRPDIALTLLLESV